MKGCNMMMKKVLGLALAVCLAAGFVFADAPASAVWIGAGDRARVNDPANWRCLDAGGNELPGAIPVASTTTVTVTGDTSFNCPVGQTPIWKTLTVSGTVNLTADCDWRGMGNIFGGYVAANTTINLKGHELFVSVPNGGTNRRINVTDNSPQGSGGRFHLDVAEGATFSNSSGWNGTSTFYFSGTMELVKDGKGTYNPAYANGSTGFLYYTYTGGTTIHEGFVVMTNDNEGTKNEDYYAQKSNRRPVFGDYRNVKPFIRIDSGATIDYKGVYDIGNYQTYMNGGTIKNTRKPATLYYGAFGNLIFEADSYLDISRTAQQGGYFYLNGHTLNVNIATNQDWCCLNGSGTNGTIVIRGEGVFHSYYTAIVAPTVTFDIGTAANLEQTMTVQNYIASYEGSTTVVNAALNVVDTFKPVTTNFYPCTMQDGSRIDLSDVTGAWNLDGTFGTLKFAPYAVVTIDVGARSLQPNEQVLKWTTFPFGVTFRIVGSTIATNFSPRMELDGLYYDLGEAGDVGVAHWTGAGRRNDFKDPANWVCTNAAGVALLDAVPNARSSVYFHSPFNFDLTNSAVLASYQSVYFDLDVQLSGDCDWRGYTVNEFFMDKMKIDLAGHSMRLAGVNGDSTCTFTVTNSVEETLGSFIFDVPADATFINSTILFQGAITVVKDGPGKFLPHRYNQTYTGGTHIAAGTLQLYKAASGDYSPAKANFPLPLGARTSATASNAVVTVDAGATYDINGLYDCCIYTVVLNGGTLTNAGNQPEYTYGGLGALTLQQDSTIVCDHSTVFTQSGSWWNLNGHTLFIETSNGSHLYRNGVSATNGTIVVTGDGLFDVNSNTFNAPGVTLDSASWICANGLIVVDNYVSHYTGKTLSGTQRIEVTKSFKPVTDSFSTVALREGVVIDLSERTNAFNVVGVNNGQVIYPAGTTNIVIDVGSRVPAPEEQLVAWTAIPEGINFTLRGENLQATDGIFLVENGIFFNLSAQSRTVMRASWTGAAGDDDFTNPANWTCQNAFRQTVTGGVPVDCTFVTINGPCAFDLPLEAEKPFPWQKLSIESCSLTKDCDWRGLGSFNPFIAANATIDLRGHKLTVSAPNATVATAMTFTDTTSNTNAPGEFHCEVASGTFTNTGVGFTGNLRFVKEGEGIYVPSKINQSYTGGNEIMAGQIKINNPANAGVSTYAMGQTNGRNPLGVYNAKPIVINTNTVYDINGIYDSGNTPVELAGGTLKNSKAITYYSNWGAMNNVTVTVGGSTFDVAANTEINGSNFDLGGHELNVKIGATLFMHGGMRNGTLKILNGGWAKACDGFDARTVTFDVNCALDVASTLNVSNYIARYEYNYNKGTGEMAVWGTFTPISTKFYGCTLQNGSTLNLADKTDVWDTTADFPKDDTNCDGRKIVTFAENATINIDFGERELEMTDGQAKIISWATPPDSTVKFKSGSKALAGNRRFCVKDDGLYVMRKSLTIFIR